MNEKLHRARLGVLLQVRTAGIAIGKQDIPAKGTAISKAVEIIINGLKVSLDLSAGAETAAQRLSISFSPAFLFGCRTASGASLSGTWGF